MLQKNFLFPLIILIAISCGEVNDKKAEETVNIENAQVSDTNEADSEEAFRKKINKEFKQEYAKTLSPQKGVTNLNGKKEFWRINKLEDGKRIIQIESHDDDTYFREVYYSQNNKLIFAEENMNYMPENHLTQQAWSCGFYMKDGELFTIMSLGHGKTESEDWEPEIILEMFADRMKEYEILIGNAAK